MTEALDRLEHNYSNEQLSRIAFALIREIKGPINTLNSEELREREVLSGIHSLVFGEVNRRARREMALAIPIHPATMGWAFEIREVLHEQR